MMVLKLVMAALISVGQFYLFDWGVYLQVLLLLTALISHKVQPYILSNDNFLQQAVLLVLAAMLSIVNAGSEVQSKTLSTSGVIALAGVCLVGLGVVAFILIDNRLTKQRNLKADPTRDPAARLEQRVDYPPVSGPSDTETVSGPWSQVRRSGGDEHEAMSAFEAESQSVVATETVLNPLSKSRRVSRSSGDNGKDQTVQRSEPRPSPAPRPRMHARVKPQSDKPLSNSGATYDVVEAHPTHISVQAFSEYEKHDRTPSVTARRMFQSIDRDNSNSITASEFMAWLAQRQQNTKGGVDPVLYNDLRFVWSEMDKDGSGALEWPEFSELLRTYAEADWHRHFAPNGEFYVTHRLTQEVRSQMPPSASTVDDFLKRASII